MGSPDEVLAHTQRFYRQRVYKSSTLHGLGEGRDALAAGATPLIVEGPMDKLAVDKLASQFKGNSVALASCGTSLTTEHLVLISAITDKPVWSASTRMRRGNGSNRRRGRTA